MKITGAIVAVQFVTPLPVLHVIADGFSIFAEHSSVHRESDFRCSWAARIGEGLEAPVRWIAEHGRDAMTSRIGHAIGERGVFERDRFAGGISDGRRRRPRGGRGGGVIEIDTGDGFALGLGTARAYEEQAENR
ncbi:hypothetical protein GCM10011515_10760 [Tsuneonella deserti]|uniref:Uncharacterized protein n=1 Tax=Tsuneonella deserti TaxID=2035528 RepID=A0ABQ1S6V2_9SPHN|nr:hypothetical protein GCM10011515_10760 [Tsuneonella deserti]